MPQAFVRHNGQVLTFGSEAEADAFVAQNPPEPVFQGGPAQEAAYQHSLSPEGRVQAPATRGPIPVQPEAVPAPEESPPGEPSQNVRMTRGDGEIWRYPRHRYNELSASGWREVTPAELRVAQEEKEAKFPYGEDGAGGFLSSAYTGAEQLASAAVGGIPAAIESIDTGESVGHEEYFAALVSKLPGSASKEEIEKGMRLRKKEHQLASMAGETLSYIAGGGLAKAGLSRLAAKTGTTIGTGAAVAGYGAEGAIVGGMSANENAWMENRDLTRDELLMAGVYGGTVGLVIPGALAGAKAGKAHLKKVFEPLKKKTQRTGAELGGELADAANAQGGAASLIERGKMAIVGGKSGMNDKRLIQMNVNPERYRKKVAAGKMEIAEDITEGNLARFTDLKKNDGTKIALAGHDDVSRVQQAKNVLERGQELNSTIDDALIRETYSLREIDDAFAKISQKGKMEAFAPEADVITRARAQLRSHMEAQGVNPSTGSLSGAEGVSLWRNMMKQASMNPDDAPGLARAMEALEDLMVNKAAPGAGKAFKEAVEERKFLRDFMPGATDLLAGANRQPSTLGMFDGLIELGKGHALGVSGLHDLSAATMKLRGGRGVIEGIRNYVGKKITAQTYAKRLALIEESTDSALKSAMGRGSKTAAWANESWNNMGGYIDKAFQNSVIPATRIPFARKGQSEQESYQGRMQEISSAAQNQEATINAMNGRLGPAAEHHPQLTGELANAHANALSYLFGENPVGLARGVSPLTPNLKAHPPSSGEIKSFARKWEAVMNPWSVLDDVGNGRVSPEAVSAIQAVYPAFYTSLQEKTMAALAELPKPLPFAQAQQMETVLQMPGVLTKAASPDFQQRYSGLKQLAEAAEAQQGGQRKSQQGAGGGRPKGNPTISQQLRSPVDQANQNIHN